LLLVEAVAVVVIQQALAKVAEAVLAVCLKILLNGLVIVTIQ
tara:strand:- start:524 stop:649 length:126 start_codon:yes stop_codon:yes gene_type:complete